MPSTTKITYDIFSNPQQVTQLNGRIDAYSYDVTSGLLDDVTYAQGSLLSLSVSYGWGGQGGYMPTDEIINATGPDYNFTYNTNTNLLSSFSLGWSDPSEKYDQIIWNYTYNGNNLLATASASAFTDKGVMAYTYNSVGRLTTITSGSEILTIGYNHSTNGIGHLTSVTSTSKANLTFAYNPFWSVTQIQATDAGDHTM